MDQIPAGDTRTLTVAPGTCVRIMTGALMPGGADAVVPVEWTDGGTQRARFSQPAPAGHAIRRRGDDGAEGDVLLSAGARPGHKVHNAYGYGLFTGGLGAHYGIERLGATAIPMWWNALLRMFWRCPSSGGFSFSMSWVRTTAICAITAPESATGPPSPMFSPAVVQGTPAAVSLAPSEGSPGH